MRSRQSHAPTVVAGNSPGGDDIFSATGTWYAARPLVGRPSKRSVDALEAYAKSAADLGKR
jgi:hypothetical protein